MIAKLTKTQIARRQLGTALALYLQGKDSISVHCLACGGCEIAEHLVQKAERKPIRHFTQAANPSLTDATFFSIRNQHWNAFKHARRSSGKERNDDDLLASFTERDNEERLFLGWSDYGFATERLPIEAQVFTTWFLTLDDTKLQTPEGQEFLGELDRVFPNLRELPYEKQRRRLKSAIEKCRKDRVLMNDPKTERLPLILPAV